MKDLLSNNQYENLRFVLMWHADWKKALHTDTAGMSYQEMLDHDEHMQWYAHMAVKDCEEAGLNPDLLLSHTLIGHAWEYKNEVLPRRLERTREELEAEGII